MISSRNRGLCLAVLIGSTALALGPAALGQTAAPSEPAPAATGAPRALSGTQPAQSGPSGSESTSAPGPQGPAAGGGQGSPSPSGITVQTLGDTEGPPTGTLDSMNGGLGRDLWSGSTRADAEQLMGRLPLATTIAPVRALARRIVLTKAAVPIGDADQAFMTVRIRSLLHAGLLNDAAALATLADVKNDPGFARVQAEALLFAGEQEHLCDNTTATRLESSEPFWIELRAYCYATSGDDAALALTQSVMDAQNINDDAFDTLLQDVQSGVSKDPGDIEAPTALHLFLLRRVGLPVSYDTGVQLGTSGLLLVLESKDNSPEDRLKAAERVLRAGALSSSALIALADAQPFTADQFATEYAQVQTLPFLAGQALLRQAVARAAPDAKPALIYEALTVAQAKYMLGVAAVLQHDALAALTPQPDMRTMADLMGRALMLTGDATAAARWAGLLDPTAVSDKPLLARFQIMLNLVAPDTARRAAAQRGLSELVQELKAKTSNQAFAALALGLYEALGEVMPDAARKVAATAMATTWPGRRPAASLLARLDRALQGHGRKGEALMLILNAIGVRGPGDLAPDVTVRLVRALIAEGQANAAHGIAIAALLRYRPAPPPPPLAAAPAAK